MKTLTVSLEQKIRLAWLIGQLTGNVALFRLAFSILDKLKVGDVPAGDYSVNITNGEVTFHLKTPAVAKIIPAPVGKAETAQELADRTEKNAQAQRDAESANIAAIAKVASAPSTVELTDAEAAMLTDSMDSRRRLSRELHSWIDGVSILDKEAAPSPTATTHAPALT